MKVIRRLNSELFDFDKMDEVVHESLEGTEVELSEVKYKKLSEGVAYLGYDSNKGAVIATLWIGGGIPEEFDVEYPNKYYIEGNSADDHIYVCKEQTLDDVLSNPENVRMNNSSIPKSIPDALSKIQGIEYTEGIEDNIWLVRPKGRSESRYSLQVMYGVNQFEVLVAPEGTREVSLNSVVCIITELDKALKLVWNNIK